jgi:hypothetical protein
MRLADKKPRLVFPSKYKKTKKKKKSELSRLMNRQRFAQKRKWDWFWFFSFFFYECKFKEEYLNKQKRNVYQKNLCHPLYTKWVTNGKVNKFYTLNVVIADRIHSPLDKTSSSFLVPFCLFLLGASRQKNISIHHYSWGNFALVFPFFSSPATYSNCRNIRNIFFFSSVPYNI